jgi:hypothetical protein
LGKERQLFITLSWIEIDENDKTFKKNVSGDRVNQLVFEIRLKLEWWSIQLFIYFYYDNPYGIYA